MTSEVSRYVATLLCLHRVDSSVEPRRGEEFFCRPCGEPQVVVSWAAVWRVRCLDCRLHRSYGAARVGAGQAMSHHARTHVEHRVELWEGLTRRDGICYKRGMATLTSSEDPPF